MATEHGDPEAGPPLRDQLRNGIAALPPSERLMALRAVERHDFDIDLTDDSMRFVIAGLWTVEVPIRA